MILLDMDGCIADFCGGACELHGKDPKTIDSWNFFEDWGMTEEEFWEPIVESGVEFWETLKPYPWTDKLLKMVERADSDFFVCTRPGRGTGCIDGKMEWLRARLGEDWDRYHFTQYKHHLAEPWRLLIDDSDVHCNEFSCCGGMSCLFPQPWNANADYTEDRLGIVSMALQAYQMEVVR
jgi:hypothetical protein